MSNAVNTLTNPNATPSAQKLYRFLCDGRGGKMLAGQQESPCNLNNGDELSYIEKTTSQLPAILGLDYIENDFEGVNERALEWHRRGGIVSICWHWGIPPYGIGYPSSQESIDIAEALTPQTALNRGMIENMDAVARALSELCKADIPVLWRPFHEFDGAWFWWGKGGAEQFKQLWHLMYERFTHVFHLDNLIWVLGYSGECKSGWYPGDDVVDIIGGDAYSDSIHEDMYRWLLTQSNKKMPVCHHENGPIPDPALMQERAVDWSWFLTWHTIHIHDQNTPEYLQYIYHHPSVITLEKLREIY